MAVHPDDPRYKHLIGKALVHPFLPDREMVIIADPILVDMAFGTGAVKITPAHDPNDFECGRRNNLPRINILDDNGLINGNGGNYQGMHRFAVREKIIQDLTALDLYRGKENNKMAVGLCSRSKDIVEPIIRPQWWVDCKEMAARSIDAAKTKDLKILPVTHENTWFRWLENIQDWCISRQLWWGHRIPAFYAKKADETFPTIDEDPTRWFIAADEAGARAQLAERFPVEAKEGTFTLVQDNDVLDTWFSSGLFPFSVMHWPNTQHGDFSKFFPGDLLETGQDILFFWVARMVMMSLALTDKLPFHTVYLHSMVRDRIGRKMSKSLGNVIDPLDMIYGIALSDLQKKLEGGNLEEKEVKTAQENQAKDFPQGIPACGADGLRFGLLGYTRQGSDINLDPNRVVVARSFCNKMWQAVRFALQNFPPGFVAPASLADMDKTIAAAGGATIAQKWILSRLHACVQASENGFTRYEFGDMVFALQNYFTDELCARYLELIKGIVKADTPAAASHLAVFFICLDYGLRLIHPVMPFVTEELWHRLPGHAERTAAAAAAAGPGNKRAASGSLMIAPFPRPAWTAGYSSAEAETDMQVLDQTVTALRSAKTAVNLTRAQRPDVYIVCEQKHAQQLLRTEGANVSTLAACGNIITLLKADGDVASKIPDACMTTVISGELTAYVAIGGMVDMTAEVIKTERKFKELAKSQETLLVESRQLSIWRECFESQASSILPHAITETMSRTCRPIASSLVISIPGN